LQHLCSSKVAYARVAMRRGWTNEEIMRFNVQVKGPMFDQALRASLEKVVTASGSGVWLAIPMFSEGNLCPSCNAHQIDQWGDHAVHCSSEVGVKFQHNLDGKDLRHADLLLFNWLQVKDACLDVTCISPFAGMGATSWAPGVALHNVMENKSRKEFDMDALDTLSRIKSTSISHSNNDKRLTRVRYVIGWVFPYSLSRSSALLAPRISAGKEVNIELGGGRDKPLCPADMLLYSWDGELDVCVYLTGSLPLTQTGMIDFLPRRAVTEATQRKHVKYEAKCAEIIYGFLPFSFSSFGELERDAITLLKRIPKWLFIVASAPHTYKILFLPSLLIAWGREEPPSVPLCVVLLACSTYVLRMHNLLRDILVDICSKVVIMVRKKAQMGFLSEDEKDLQPADLLLFNWLQGKDACLDVTDISPFAVMGATFWASGVTLHNVVKKKKKKVCVNM
ncbi:hypothetical protein Tco_1059730, partial [Tanacetum coccineum]